MKINSKKVKASIKNVYRKTLKAAMVSGLVFSSVLGGYNVARETYEEMKGNNLILDFDLGFGSVVIANKDKRTPMQVFDDAKKAALSVEGLEDAYINGGSYSVEQKKEFITKFCKTVAESAGVRLEKVEFVSREKINGANGVYRGYNNKFFAVTQNKIWIAEDMLNLQSNFPQTLESTYHEMIHLIEGVNIQTNKNTKNLDINIFNQEFTYGKKKVYRSNFREFTAQLLANDFAIQLHQIHGEESSDFALFYTRKKLSGLIFEIIENDMHYNNNNQDFYKNLTVREIFNIGLKNNYKNKGVSISETKLENIYTNQIIERTIHKETLDANYYDFLIGTLEFINLNLTDETYVLLMNIDDFKNGKYKNLLPSETNIDFITKNDYIDHAQQALALQMAKVKILMQYNNDFVLKEQIEDTANIILNNLYLLPEALVNHYRLKDVKEFETHEILIINEQNDEMIR